MRQVRQGVRSTKEKMTVVEETDNSNQHVPLRKHHDIYVQINHVRDTIYTDRTGKFPIILSRGHKYIMILYAIDGNVLLANLVKIKQK